MAEGSLCIAVCGQVGSPTAQPDLAIVSHCRTQMNGFVYLTSVIMDAREQKKVLRLVCGAVSPWAHWIADRKQVAALAATQGSARAGHGAHVNTQLVLVSVELQQS